VRGVVYNDSRGGYIDNVAGSFHSQPHRRRYRVSLLPANGRDARQASDMRHTIRVAWEATAGLSFLPGVVPKSPTINNDNIVARSINPVVYRACASQRCTTLPSSGTFWSRNRIRTSGQMACLRRCHSAPAARRCRTCRWCNSIRPRTMTDSAIRPGRSTVVSISSRSCIRAAIWCATSSSFRTTRTTHAASMLITISVGCRGLRSLGTNSAVGGYQKVNPADPGECFLAELDVSRPRAQHSPEPRASPEHSDDWRLRAIGGLFYEDSWCRTSPTGCTRRRPNGIYGTSFNPLQAPAASSANNHKRAPRQRGVLRRRAAWLQAESGFTSIDFELLPKKLTLTVGTRYYRMDTFETGAKAGSFDCRAGGIYSAATVANPCTVSALNLDTVAVPAGNSAIPTGPWAWTSCTQGSRVAPT